MNALCFLIPAIVGVISGILGYLLGKMHAGKNAVDFSMQNDLSECKEINRQLSDRIVSQENELSSARSALDAFAETASASLAAAFDPDQAFLVMKKKVKLNDLKVVEGIGPKIESLYHAAGIATWKQLSETSVEKSYAILKSGIRRFSVHNPSTWARQAELAFKGKWQELKNWQAALHRGKE